MNDQIRQTALWGLLRKVRRAMRQSRKERRVLEEWDRSGRPAPPPSFHKQRVIRDYGRRFGTGTLIETGTYLGEMVEACRTLFRRVYSIELDPKLFADAAAKFAPHGNVTILHGDSGVVLPELIGSITEPCLFWLDGHYSSGITARGELETPISAELESILAHPVRDHVILIDDARCFTGESDYPAIEALRSTIAERRPGWTFEVADDIIRIHRPER